jgi:hypothetical protein
MKTKYIFYLLLMLVMHYEVSRLIESNQQMENNLQRDMQDSSYQKDTRLTVARGLLNPGQKLHFIKLSGGVRRHYHFQPGTAKHF